MTDNEIAAEKYEQWIRIGTSTNFPLWCKAQDKPKDELFEKFKEYREQVTIIEIGHAFENFKDHFKDQLNGTKEPDGWVVASAGMPNEAFHYENSAKHEAGERRGPTTIRPFVYLEKIQARLESE